MTDKTDKSDLVGWLERGSTAVYLAAEEAVAADISEGMKLAAREITRLRAREARLLAMIEPSEANSAAMCRVLSDPGLDSVQDSDGIGVLTHLHRQATGADDDR